MIPLSSFVSLLGRYLRPHRRRVLLLALLLVASIAVALLVPQLLQRIIDGALDDTGVDVTATAAWVVVLAVSLQVLRVLATWLAEDLGWRATNCLRADLSSHVLGLDLAFHSSHAPGELIERVDGDVTALSNFFSAMVVHVVANGVLLLGIVVLMTRELAVVGVAASVLMAASAVAIVRLHTVVSRWWRAERASSGDAASQVGEIVEATQDIAANGARDHVLERYADVLRGWQPRRVRAWGGWGVLWGTSEVFQLALLAAVVVLATRRLGVTEVGSIYLLVHYADMIGEPLHQLRQQLADLQKAGGAISRVAALQATESSLQPAGTSRLSAGPLSLTLDRVSFAYHAVSITDEDARDEPRSEHSRVLHGIDVHVPAGRVLGVVGRTGSGKSTLARLVARLHVPDAGTIRLHDVPIDDVADVRDRIAMVSQDVRVFAASVRDNLTMWDDSVDDERLTSALATMGLGPWYAGLPDGLDTQVGGAGIGLSSGQAQLLAFTRALLADPGLVVLDEASSRLDPSTEALLERAVDTLLTDRTAVIIAHRLHTLERADDILVLADGRVVEHGPREALARDQDSHYANLLATGLEEVLA